MVALPGNPSASVLDKINRMVRRIVEVSSPERIVLFGSYARGEAGPDSDVDLLVVSSRAAGGKRRLAVSIDMALLDIGLPKDVVVVTPEECERFRDVVGTVIYPALHEGVVVYERAA